jgi:hypothetical protein
MGHCCREDTLSPLCLKAGIDWQGEEEKLAAPVRGRSGAGQVSERRGLERTASQPDRISGGLRLGRTASGRTASRAEEGASKFGTWKVNPMEAQGMVRLAWSIFSISTFLTAWAFYKSQQRATDPRRRVPVKEAVAKLQEAWSDYHTRA